jgi:hypothetical protein
MYVNALFGCWSPGGSTCDLAPRSGRARADGGGGRVRHPGPRRSRRGGAGGGGAERYSGALAERARGHRRDFAKGLCEGTFRRDKLGLFEGTFEEGLSKGLFAGSEHLHNGDGTLGLGFSTVSDFSLSKHR